MQLAPILLFTYNRLELTKKTLSALQRNFLAGGSELYIYSDGAKNEKDADAVTQVRKYLKTVSGFRKIVIHESIRNNGLANSIISGVTRVINEHGKVIVLEDDLITSKVFLSFINQALEHYKDNSGIFSVAGYTRAGMKGLHANEVYFTKRASSWGWATWKEKWADVDWDVRDYGSFAKDRTARNEFNKMGSDMAGMLDRQMRGEINSWAIRWCYHQFKNSLYTVYPAISKISNIGFSEEATHTKDKFNRFRTELDDTDNTEFSFSNDLRLDEKIIKQFTRPFSIPERIRYKLLNTLPKF
jgi:hypothetical protein